MDKFIIRIVVIRYNDNHNTKIYNYYSMKYQV